MVIPTGIDFYYTESVEVIDGFGIQLSSRARFGKENKTFFEFSAVKDVIINEAVKMVCFSSRCD